MFADERGAAALEYGLIVSLIVIAMLSALQSVASTTTDMWNTVANVLAD
ncbi:MAG: Flp family type IVb pilin [Pseudomonadota bacterium]|nr:Flp family type IVb pilin [Pseudomonadota bacterium]